MPHMIYNPRLPYRLEGLAWGVGHLSPRGLTTSGITQPPMLAIAAETVAAALPPDQGRQLIADLLPVITRFHQWIYRERDPNRTGLAACLHSWECGMDDTPYWTEAMEHLPALPWRWRWLREYRWVKADERATPSDLRRMLSLARILKQYHYDSAAIIQNSPVVIQDLVFNAVLAAANESLERLAETIGQSVPADLHAHFAPTRRALESLWDHDCQLYCGRELVSGQSLCTPTIAAFMPLFAGTASPAHAKHLHDLLGSTDHGFNSPHPLPTVPLTSPHFEPKRFWKGPVWINMNWFVIRGLRRYGYTTAADHLRLQTLALVQRSGFREYYNPLTGDGLGARNFSWSAALVIDLLEN